MFSSNLKHSIDNIFKLSLLLTAKDLFSQILNLIDLQQPILIRVIFHKQISKMLPEELSDSTGILPDWSFESWCFDLEVGIGFADVSLDEVEVFGVCDITVFILIGLFENVGCCGLVDRHTQEPVGPVEKRDEFPLIDEVVLSPGKLALFVHLLEGQFPTISLQDVVGLC